MKRLAILAALVAVGVAVPLSIGSSHREAPRILKDPTADNTDVWAYTAKDAPGSLTVVSNWIPAGGSGGRPNFYPLDENARYYVKFDNTGDGYEDVAYRWDFDTKFRNPNSFLYAAPTVDSVKDPDLNLVQTYDLYKETYNRKRKLTGVKRIANDAPVAPDNVGPKTIPNYAQVEAGATTSLKGGGKTAVIPADDAFFVDLGTIFDGVNLDKPGRPNIGLGNQGGGKDDVAGYNTKSFVLQVPEREVTRDRKQVSGRRRRQRRGRRVVYHRAQARYRGPLRQVPKGKAPASASTGPGQPPREPPHQRGDRPDRHEGQVQRNVTCERREELRPVRSEPRAGAHSQCAVQARDQGDEPDRHRAGAADWPARSDPDRQEPGRSGHAQAQPGRSPSANPSRFGALAGDNGGFPNGRRLIDDVVDIELRVIAGALLPANQGGKQIPLGDGVDRNDKPFRSCVPVRLARERRVQQHAQADRAAARPVPQPPN